MIGSVLAVRALSVGYLLGRRRTRRMASVLAAAAAAGCLGELGVAALRRGMNMPEPAQAPGKAARSRAIGPAPGRPPPP